MDRRLNRQNLNMLYALQALLHCRTVSEAADTAHISQPAMSQALQKLRQHFADDLVTHRSGRSYFTPLADALRPRVRHLIQSASELFELSVGFDPATDMREVSIVAPDVIETLFVSRAVQEILRQGPGMMANLHSYNHLSSEALFAERVDLVIVPSHLADPALPSFPLLSERMGCMVWEAHPAIGDMISIEDYSRAHHAALSEGADVLHPADPATRLMLSRRDVRVRAPSYAALCPIVTGTDLVVTTTARYAQFCASTMPLKAVTAPREFPEIEIVMQCAPHRRSEPLILWLMDILSEVVGTLR